MSNGNFLWILVNRKLARRDWAGLGLKVRWMEHGANVGVVAVGGAEWGRGSIGAMIGGWRLRTTSELIIALPTAYITTVAVSVRSIDILV